MIMSLLLLIGMQSQVGLGPESELMGMQDQYQVNWISRVTRFEGHGACLSKSQAKDWVTEASAEQPELIYWVSRCGEPQFRTMPAMPTVEDWQSQFPNDSGEKCIVYHSSADGRYVFRCDGGVRIEMSGLEPEPLDVPAIQEERTTTVFFRAECEGIKPKGKFTLSSKGETPHMDIGTCVYLQWTCDPKTRILEHDEQELPLCWCRRPQTKEKP